jgi:predicted ATPase
MKANYVPGSFHKKFYGSYASQLKRRTVSNITNSVNTYGSSIFTTKQAQTESLNELIVKKVAEKLQIEAQKRLKSAAGMQASITGLGAFTDSSA